MRYLVAIVVAACLAIAASAAVGASTPPYVSDAARRAILRRAQVWIPPAQPVAQANLRVNPPGFFAGTGVVNCRFTPTAPHGRTPEFDCRADGGGLVRVRYGQDNPDVYTRVAATRLMAAIGFPANRVWVVARVRCFGCPAKPFDAIACLEKQPARRCFPRVDYTRFRDFAPVILERPLEGRSIASRRHRGWSWPELDRIDPAAGGAKRAEVDALKLMTAFLDDRTTTDTRLLCLGVPGDRDRCRYPAAMLRDLGRTFDVVDLDRWARAPIWTDAERCVVSIRGGPRGGTIDAKISEAGRLLLADGLRRLTGPQLHDLFDGARFQLYPRATPPGRDLANWIRVFSERVRALADRPPCPE